MFSVPRFLGGLAAAGLSTLAALPSVQAAGSLGYSDPLCTAFFADPASPPPNQVLKCAKMQCSVLPNPGYNVTVGTQVTLTVSCQNPTASSYKWILSPRSDAGCPLPTPDNSFGIQVISATPRTCFYEAIMSDSATPTPNAGWVRYGVVWR